MLGGSPRLLVAAGCVGTPNAEEIGMNVVKRVTGSCEVLLIAALLLAACSPGTQPETTSLPPAVTSPPATGQADGSVDLEAAFAERDRFFADQMQPLDGSPLTAQTDEQGAFILSEKEFVESNGLAWSQEAETMYLALALDACEASILQGHEITDELFMLHLATSPLFAALVPDEVVGEQRRNGERNSAAKMVAGVSYLCKEDLPQWLDAYNRVYPPAALGEEPLGG